MVDIDTQIRESLRRIGNTVPDRLPPDVDSIRSFTSSPSRASIGRLPRPSRMRRWIPVAAAGGFAVVIAAAVLVFGSTNGSQRAASPSHVPVAVSLTLDTVMHAGSGYAAGISGKLEGAPVDGRACLLIGKAPVVWPRGFRAQRLSSGVISVLDQSGKEVARAGEAINAGGGFIASRSRYQSSPCFRDQPREYIAIGDLTARPH